MEWDLQGMIGGMEGKKKGKKKGRKESSFPAPEWLPPSLLGKERNPPETQCFQGIRRKKEREKEEEMDGFRIRFLRRDSGEKGWKKGREKKGKNALFQSFRGAFLSPEEGRNPVISREGNGKKKEKKDEVLGLEDRIFRGRLEEW